MQKTNYTCKFLKLEHDIEETQDLLDYPIITMFADRFNLGNLIEITYEEWNGCNSFFETTLMTVEDANDFYTRHIKMGYKVTEEMVN